MEWRLVTLEVQILLMKMILATEHLVMSIMSCNCAPPSCVTPRVSSWTPVRKIILAMPPRGWSITIVFQRGFWLVGPYNNNPFILSRSPGQEVRLQSYVEHQKLILHHRLETILGSQMMLLLNWRLETLRNMMQFWRRVCYWEVCLPPLWHEVQVCWSSGILKFLSRLIFFLIKRMLNVHLCLLS